MLAPVKGSCTAGKAGKSGAGDKVDWIMAGPKKIKRGFFNCSQAMSTEKTNRKSTPPAITSFSPARSGASSLRKC